jgi:hypothetical protein
VLANLEPVNRSVVVVAALLVASACGGDPTADPESVPTSVASTLSEPVDGQVATGTELAGVAFDVRRDPG